MRILTTSLISLLLSTIHLPTQAAFFSEASLVAVPVVLGNYQPVSTNDLEVIYAAQFAAKHLQQGKLIRVVNVKRQLIAGFNYLMTLQLDNGVYQVRVHQDLQHHLNISDVKTL